MAQEGTPKTPHADLAELRTALLSERDEEFSELSGRFLVVPSFSEREGDLPELRERFLGPRAALSRNPSDVSRCRSRIPSDVSRSFPGSFPGQRQGLHRAGTATQNARIDRTETLLDPRPDTVLGRLWASGVGRVLLTALLVIVSMLVTWGFMSLFTYIVREGVHNGFELILSMGGWASFVGAVTLYALTRNDQKLKLQQELNDEMSDILFPLLRASHDLQARLWAFRPSYSRMYWKYTCDEREHEAYQLLHTPFLFGQLLFYFERTIARNLLHRWSEVEETRKLMACIGKVQAALAQWMFTLDEELDPSSYVDVWLDPDDGDAKETDRTFAIFKGDQQKLGLIMAKNQEKSVTGPCLHYGEFELSMLDASEKNDAFKRSFSGLSADTLMLVRKMQRGEPLFSPRVVAIQWALVDLIIAIESFNHDVRGLELLSQLGWQQCGSTLRRIELPFDYETGKLPCIRSKDSFRRDINMTHLPMAQKSYHDLVAALGELEEEKDKEKDKEQGKDMEQDKALQAVPEGDA